MVPWAASGRLWLSLVAFGAVRRSMPRFSRFCGGAGRGRLGGRRGKQYRKEQVNESYGQGIHLHQEFLVLPVALAYRGYPSPFLLS